MGTAGGIAIGGANMWALLLDKDPGDRAAATDLASDVVDRKHKKAAVAVVKVEAAPPAGRIAKPAKRGNNGKKMEKGAARSNKQAPASKVKKTNGDAGAGHNKRADGEELTDMWIRRYLSQEGTSKEEEETFTVVAAGGGRTVAPWTRKPVVAGGVTVTGANMWALLGDEDPGHSATTESDDQKHEKATAVAEVEEAPAADNMDGPILAKRVGSRGGADPVKHGKKTKTTKKKGETAAAPTTELKEMAGKVATGGSRGRKVAWCVCWVNIAIALLAF